MNHDVRALNPVPMIDWMRARQDIFRRRQRGEKPPYTKDPVLASFRFCQVFREHDHVTKWIRENWRIPYADHPNLPFAMAYARYFNEPKTLAAVGFPGEEWDPQRDHDLITELAKSQAVFRAAYIISPCGSTKPKILRVIEDYLLPVYDISRTWIVRNSLEKTHDNICKNEGFGAFMAYEVVSDLRHTEPLMNSPDIQTWANPGPGACRGIQRLLGKKGEDVRRSLPRAFQIDCMQTLLVHAKMALRNDDLMFKKLEMRDIENALCETDKWLRAKTGEGTPKQRWTP